MRALLGILLSAPLVAADEIGVELGRELETTHGAVACVDHHAARIGAEVLARGGNAVDAAVAVAFALAVTHPAAGNIGGGGFLVYCEADGGAHAVDYREVAPARAHAEMFLDEHGAIDRDKSGIGHWVVGVPGTVAGLELAHQRFGTLDWSSLVRPARELAAQGIEVDEDLARGLAANTEKFALYSATARCFLHEDGRPYRQGEIWRQPDLANSLRWIEEGGAEAFYRGPIATLIDAEMRRAEALLTAEDLANYRAVLREPIRFQYREWEVVSMPPPSSGGVALAQMFGILEPLQLAQFGPESSTTRHFLAEAQRRAFAQRAEFLGDPEAVHVPIDDLLAPTRLDALRNSVDPQRATPSRELGPPVTTAEGSHTTHFSIVDGDGNAVANTYTLEDSYGSRVIAEGTGFLLNNELHDFNLKPGLTDERGRIGTEPNLARPGYRPLSSMTPTIVRRGGRVRLVTGSPGGRTIINTVAGIVLRVVEFEQDPAAAVHAPRQHHQWFPDRLRVEAGVEEEVRLDLEALGHRVEAVARQGDAHTIAVDAAGAQRAIADRRIDGWVATPVESPSPR